MRFSMTNGGPPARQITTIRSDPSRRPSSPPHPPAAPTTSTNLSPHSPPRPLQSEITPSRQAALFRRFTVTRATRRMNERKTTKPSPNQTAPHPPRHPARQYPAPRQRRPTPIPHHAQTPTTARRRPSTP